MTFIIADPGADHMGELGRMYALFDAAKYAHADAVKPQLYRAESLYADESMRAKVRQYEMPLEWLPLLAEYAKRIGIEFMCSAFSKDLYDKVDPYVSRHKIASLEAGDLDLVRHVVAFGKPVIISTGSATTEEVFALREEAPDATFLQCSAAYPAPIDETDLRAIPAVCDGFSDHTTSLISGAVAAARGAIVVEKHIMLGYTQGSGTQPDAPHSLSRDDFAMYVRYVREAERLLGSVSKTIRPSEQALRPLRRTAGKLRGEA